MSMFLRPCADSGLLDVETMAVGYLTGSRNTQVSDKSQCESPRLPGV